MSEAPKAECGKSPFCVERTNVLAELWRIVRGRPSWPVAGIIAFLGIVGSIGWTLHFDETGPLNQVIGQQSLLLDSQKDLKAQLEKLERRVESLAGHASAGGAEAVPGTETERR